MSNVTFMGRSAWRIETALLRTTLMQSGGHLAEFMLRGQDAISPLWVQTRPTIDSESYSSIAHGSLFGTGPEARLLSGLIGHNLCFPFWGDPSEAEFAAGMTYHGESNIRRWHLVAEAPDTLTIGVELPESRTSMHRRLRAHGYALHVESTARNLSSWDRPVGWCEHVTFGPPFLDADGVVFDASAGRGIVTSKPDGEVFSWPQGIPAPTQTGSTTEYFNLRSFSSESHSPLVNSFLVKRDAGWGYFTAYSSRFSLLCGYCFPVADFPWLNVWQNVDDRFKARGMEFSNTPHHGTMRALISKPEMWGVPTYDWLNAQASLTKRFIAFCFPVAAPFYGTDQIAVKEDLLEVHEQRTARVIPIPI